ncbi:flagellar motor protein MotB [Eubacteriales bacterium OttesenSCG-928-N14]|nr:flagellar motor protein MotB [Eubacteriales bacterium OttesenSCG-928-N14]
MARKRESQDVGEGANWMDTYGDLVTLILCFFVLLYSFSTIDAAKWEQLVMSFTGAFPSSSRSVFSLDSIMQNPVDVENMNQNDNEDSGQQWENEQKFQELYEILNAYIQANGLGDQLAVERQGEMIILIMTESRTYFDSGRAELRPEAKETLDEILPMLEESIEFISLIRVVGHTDNVPISTSVFPSNWSLSVARAASVTEYIMKTSAYIDHTKVEPSGKGEYEPIDTNETEEGRARNRRVEFQIYSQNMDWTQ